MAAGPSPQATASGSGAGQSALSAGGALEYARARIAYDRARDYARDMTDTARTTEKIDAKLREERDRLFDGPRSRVFDLA